MNRKKKHQVKDPDIRGVEAALKRAAKTARRVAKATNTPLIVWEDGKVAEKWVR